MKDRHEQDIDTVLQALGAAQPAAGLQDRVLRRLAQTERKPKHHPGRFWYGAGAAFALACLALVILWPVHRPERVGSGQVAGIATPAPVRLAELSPGNAMPSSSHPAARLVLARRAPVTASRRPSQQASNRGLADLPSMLAVHELTTQQEHLLVEVAHGPGPVEFAMLNPEHQAKLAQQSAAEFKQSFPPPTPQEIYLATHTQN